MKMNLFQYAILWHPTPKQETDEGLKTTILVEPQTILAKDIESATMSAAMQIPQNKREEIDQIEIVLRPF